MHNKCMCMHIEVDVDNWGIQTYPRMLEMHSSLTSVHIENI
jgi:hypothetical protein